MNYEIDKSAQFPTVTYTLEQGDTLNIQSGSMIYQTGDVSIQGRLNASGSGLGKLVKAVARSVVSGESVFITEVSSGPKGGQIALAPQAPGSIQELHVSGDTQYHMNDSSFLALDGDTKYTMERQSAGRAFFGGQGGFFVMTTQGEGTVLVASFGSIKEIDLNNVENFTVDNAHVVAWETSLNYDIHLAGGGWVNSIGTGEGIVNTFNGSGKLYIQSLNLETFAHTLIPFLPTPNNNSGN
ncbi:MAG: TIGR00266 family protein [Lactobacillaceae bacterium]|jgi:uncharacterized protein (TIGR00266 family)|nr:TIGR00266 family protein [Lactobacillaceae bacterium]